MRKSRPCCHWSRSWNEWCLQDAQDGTEADFITSATADILGKVRAMPDKQQKEKPKTAKRPVHEVRLGKIKAAIWANDTENGVRHNVTLTRLYKDGETWKDSTTFGRDDLPLVAKVVDMAHTWIFEHGNQESGSES